MLDRFGVGPDGKIPEVGRYATTDPVRNLLITGYRLVADTSRGVEILTFGSSPTLVGKLATVGSANAIGRVGNTLYRGTGGGLEIIDISKPAKPVLLRTIPELRSIHAMEVRGGLLYTAQGSNDGVRVYFASDPLNLIEVGHYQDPNFSPSKLARWGDRIYATGFEGMRILQYTGANPPLHLCATGPSVVINGTEWSIGQTGIVTKPLAIRIAEPAARMDMEGECENLLVFLMLLSALVQEHEVWDPFEVFIEVLDLSPTLCEPERPQPVARSAAAIATEARIDLRLDKDGLKVTQGDFSIFQNVKTPVATASSRGRIGFTIRHDTDSSATTVNAFTGPVTVTPDNGDLAPVVLAAGQAVEVTASAVGEVKQMGGVFLPSVMR